MIRGKGGQKPTRMCTSEWHLTAMTLSKTTTNVNMINSHGHSLQYHPFIHCPGPLNPYKGGGLGTCVQGLRRIHTETFTTRNSARSFARGSQPAWLPLFWMLTHTSLTFRAVKREQNRRRIGTCEPSSRVLQKMDLTHWSAIINYSLDTTQ